MGVNVDVYDPWADNEEVTREYGLELKENYNLDEYDAVVLAVAHNEFKEISSKILKLKTQNSKLKTQN